jgi:hypothetical protein
MIFKQSAQFDKELKTLKKKWRTLDNDIDVAKSAIETIYSEDAAKEAGMSLKDIQAAFFNGKRATILHEEENCKVVKMRLDCAALNNKDMLRMMFVYVLLNDEITFIELYAKNEKTREDEARWRAFVKETLSISNPIQQTY